MKSLFILVVVLAVAISANPFNAEFGHERIVGGTVATKGQFPYQVAVRVQDRPGQAFRHDCGGSILNTNFVLTAAHCTAFYTIKTLIAVVGAHHINGGTVHPLAEIINHPQYDPNTIRNDVALLKTAQPIVYTRYVQPIPISSQHAYGGFEGITSGWGLTEVFCCLFSPFIYK